MPAGQYEYLDKITGKLINGILAAAKETGHAMCGSHISGMFGFFFCEGPVSCFEDAKAAGQPGAPSRAPASTTSAAAGASGAARELTGVSRPTRRYRQVRAVPPRHAGARRVLGAQPV